MSHETRGPNFRMWCKALLGLMHMPRSDWDLMAEQSEAKHQIDLRTTPIASIMGNLLFEGAVLELRSPGELELTLFRRRGDEQPSSESHATYQFRVYEGFPPGYDYEQIVNDASTQDDDELRSLRDDQVWFAPVDKSEIDQRYVQMPSSAVAIFRPNRTGGDESS